MHTVSFYGVVSFIRHSRYSNSIIIKVVSVKMQNILNLLNPNNTVVLLEDLRTMKIVVIGIVNIHKTQCF